MLKKRMNYTRVLLKNKERLTNCSRSFILFFN